MGLRVLCHTGQRGDAILSGMRSNCVPQVPNQPNTNSVWPGGRAKELRMKRFLYGLAVGIAITAVIWRWRNWQDHWDDQEM